MTSRRVQIRVLGEIRSAAWGAELGIVEHVVCFTRRELLYQIETRVLLLLKCTSAFYSNRCCLLEINNNSSRQSAWIIMRYLNYWSNLKGC
ncbi:unnamed protein product [Sphagnum jensenii]|uniref:Uncharacterized protein n=1 Tax=Sphagnum jensenii TaxID=128206 RepID=A0ABP0VQJ4_9BRYO